MMYYCTHFFFTEIPVILWFNRTRPQIECNYCLELEIPILDAGESLRCHGVTYGEDKDTEAAQWIL